LTSDTFGFFSGSPIVTSDGTTSGSALVWVAYTTKPWGPGALRAYRPLPDDSGKLNLVFQDAYGKSAKYAMPGVGAGKIYVATSDGQVLGYGAPATSSLSATAVDFGAVVVGQDATQNAVVTAQQDATITAVTGEGAGFAVGGLPPLPASLAAGESLSIPVVFAPTEAGGYLGALAITTSAGSSAVSLSGSGQSAGASLAVTPKSLAFEGIPPGDFETLDLVVSNAGASPLEFTDVGAPSAPFTATGLPAAGDVVLPGDSVTLSVVYAPVASGMYSDAIALKTNGGSRNVYLSGASAPPAHLVITPLMIDFGNVPVGTASTLTFDLTNDGGVGLTLTNSTPPSGGEFVPTFLTTAQTLQGTTLPPGQTVTESVTFQPTMPGTFKDTWLINSSAGGGAQSVRLQGTGTLADAGSD
jgi:hypothetical protein